MDKAARTRRKPSRRRELEIARTREDILMAAARALARSGVGAVSMHEIAEEVGFSAPALYAYFDSKEAIFAELGRMLASELEATFDPPPASGAGLRPRLGVLVRRQLEWADRRRDVFVAFFTLKMRGEAFSWEGGRGRPACRGPHEYLGRLTLWLRQAARRGDLGRHDASEAACVLMGIAHGYFLRWVTAEKQQRLADQTDRILDFFFHGLTGQGRHLS